MSFFDSLSNFASEIEKALRGKPKLALKLRSCKACFYGKKFPYCTKSSPPTRILSEYWAQGCLNYTPEQPTIPTARKEEIGQQVEARGLHWYDRNPTSLIRY